MNNKIKRIRHIEMCQCGYDSTIRIVFWSGSSRTYFYDGGVGGWESFLAKFNVLSKARYIY